MAQTKLFLNEMSDGLSLFLEQDTVSGILTLVSDCNDPSDGICHLGTLRLVYDDQLFLQRLVKWPVTGRDFNFRSDGSVFFLSHMSQTEALPLTTLEDQALSESWTKIGFYSVTIQLDNQRRLTKLRFDTKIPFTNPYCK